MTEGVTTVRKPIQKLPTLLVNQIAAGEVVERPASVVKELVENALDAGAKAIVVEIEQGGIELVRVTDDGGGIPQEELGLAISPHATSKISTPEDLDRIGTMGFRGEAIASIASVSRLSIRSRVRSEKREGRSEKLEGKSGEDGGRGADGEEHGRDARATDERDSGRGGPNMGWKAHATEASVIEVEGDDVKPVRPVAGPVGTCVSVRNLFWNTPARRKFLRTVGTEQGHCVDAACTLAIAHPSVGFTVVTDGKRVLEVPTGQGPRDRALAVLGKELDGEMMEVSADRFDVGGDARGMTMWGLIGMPAIARATAKAQHVYLNGRPIRDKTIQHALREAYRGLIEPGRYPTCVLMIEMDPGAVDVNVHPAKTEVRFRDQSMVHQTVLRAVKEVLQRADLTVRVGEGAGGWSGRGEMFGAGNVGAKKGGMEAASFVDFFRREVPSRVQSVGGRFEYQKVREAIERVAPGVMGEDVGEKEKGRSTEVTEADTEGTEKERGGGQELGQTETRFGEPGYPGESSIPLPEPKDRLLQVHNSYVVTQDAEGLLIVDQHALHERVMFEVLMARIVGGGGAGSGESAGKGGRPLESQSLLVPTQVRVTRSAAMRMEELRPILEKIGIQAELLSPEAVGVQAFPSFLFERGVDPGEFIAELFERAEQEGFAPASEQALAEVLDMMACKAAVKAGDRMSDTELGDLLKLREMVERSASCPHGRPTSIRLTMRELEKRFGRG